MIVGVFCPSRLLAINVARRTRLATMSGGGPVMAWAVWWAAAAAAAWPAASSHRAAVVLIHTRYGTTAAVIDIDEGPTHDPLVSSEIMASQPRAAAYISAANSSHPADAATRVADPGPKYIRPEFTSGGNAPKSIGCPHPRFSRCLRL